MSSIVPPPREQLCNRYCSNKHTQTFSLRGLTPGVTEEGMTGLFTALDAAVVSVRMMPGGAYVNVSAGEQAR